jgi:hypothetical protein
MRAFGSAAAVYRAEYDALVKVVGAKLAEQIKKTQV